VSDVTTKYATEGPARTWGCEFCLKTFLRPCALATHRSSQHSRELRPTVAKFSGIEAFFTPSPVIDLITPPSTPIKSSDSSSPAASQSDSSTINLTSPSSTIKSGASSVSPSDTAYLSAESPNLSSLFSPGASASPMRWRSRSPSTIAYHSRSVDSQATQEYAPDSPDRAGDDLHLDPVPSSPVPPRPPRPLNPAPVPAPPLTFMAACARSGVPFLREEGDVFTLHQGACYPMVRTRPPDVELEVWVRRRRRVAHARRNVVVDELEDRGPYGTMAGSEVPLYQRAGLSMGPGLEARYARQLTQFRREAEYFRVTHLTHTLIPVAPPHLHPRTIHPSVVSFPGRDAGDGCVDVWRHSDACHQV
jgi:hypothetical protein